MKTPAVQINLHEELAEAIEQEKQILLKLSKQVEEKTISNPKIRKT